MLDFAAGLYIVAQTLSISLSWPQIRKLYRAKQSKELSLTSWSAWTVSQSITLFYGLVSHQYIWVAASVLWLSFYISMVSMIVRYRQLTIREQVINFFQLRFRFSIERRKPKHALSERALDKIQLPKPLKAKTSNAR